MGSIKVVFVKPLFRCFASLSDRLERLCRYVARPPLIPPARAHQVRYHGVFAPCARGRERVVPARTVGEGNRPSTFMTNSFCPDIRNGPRWSCQNLPRFPHIAPVGVVSLRARPRSPRAGIPDDCWTSLVPLFRHRAEPSGCARPSEFATIGKSESTISRCPTSNDRFPWPASRSQLRTLP
jgi:hypothetical protein